MGVFFFFQAEDGIRDVAVTGVQTCALPISRLLDEVLKLDSLTGESLWRRKDAKTITVRHTARVVRDAEGRVGYFNVLVEDIDRKSTRLNSSHGYISYAVFCLKKKTRDITKPPFRT